jgi:glycosyltransferase involved in cell wall biosynthesis
MKILFFVRSLELGGSQRQLAALARALARRDHQIAVVMFYGGGPNEKALAGIGVRLIELRKSSRWDIFGPFARLWSIIRAESPDILYAFLPTQTTLAALLAPFGTKTRLVFGVRAAGMRTSHYDVLSALIYRLEVILSRRADLIIANAGAGRADAVKRGMPRERIVVIPNGIDAGIFRPDSKEGRELRRQWNIAESSFVIGLVARLDPMKDHMNFLNAAAKFMRLDSNARYVCVGGGQPTYRESLMAYAQSLGLGDRVVWAGEISDARAVYNAFDISTLSSAFGEAFPNVIGEAMACGVPVVATDIGDIASIVGESGEIVPPNRADLLCAGWAKMRRRLLDEPGLRHSARQHIAVTYDVDAMAARTEAELAKII